MNESYDNDFKRSTDPALKNARVEQKTAKECSEESILPMVNGGEKRSTEDNAKDEEIVVNAPLVWNAGAEMEVQGLGDAPCTRNLGMESVRGTDRFCKDVAKVFTDKDDLKSSCIHKKTEESVPVHKEPVNGVASAVFLMNKTSKSCHSVTKVSSHGNGLTSRKACKEASVGPRRFTSSTDMLKCFNELLIGWPLDHDVNKYEHMMLEDLLKQGHPDFCEKTGTGIQAFQVRINKEFNNRCFYVIRKDGSMKDFSYRKCVNNVLSLPKNLKSKFKRKRVHKGCEFH